MDKREYFSAVDEIVKKAIVARIETQTALDEVNEKIGNRRKFSDEYIAKTLVPERNRLTVKIGDTARLANEKIERLTADYLAELEAENHLDGAALTDDARLLSVGVKLRESDIEKLIDKHSKNYTMQRLLADYAAQNDIKINRVVHPLNAEIIAAVRSVPDIASRSVSQHKHPEFYDQFMGENSQLAQIMNG